MANCIVCGKKAGLFEQLSRVIQDEEEGICSSCHPEFTVNVIDVVKELKSEEEFDEFLNNLLGLGYSEEAQSYVVKYVEGARRQWSTATQVANLSERVQSIIDKHQLSTGQGFQGYMVTKYLGVISGDAVMGTGFTNEFSGAFNDLFGSQSNTFARKMIEVRDAAKQRLIMESAKRGGNAVIGVNFDYVTFSGNMLGVFANGTSVFIEKVKDK